MSSLVAPGASKAVVRSRTLTPLEAASLANGLQADAADFYYSGWVTFLDAINGINKGFYTWATVKFYYTVFYTFRAALAYDGVCAFHVDQSPFTVDASGGASPTSCTDRGTHKTVLKTFQRRNAGHSLVSQKIGLDDAVDWLTARREAANYNKARFGEPDCEIEFDYVVRNGIRKALNAYASDTTLLYVFDPDHAMVAYPLCALQLIGNRIAPAVTASFSDDEKSFLKNRVRDRSGILNSLIGEMKRLNVIT